MRLKFVMLRVETDVLKQLVHEHNDVHVVGEQLKKRYLDDPANTFKLLQKAELPLHDMISTVLMIEKFEDNRLDNGLDLRHRLFSENRDAVALVERFLRDSSMTIERLK